MNARKIPEIYTSLDLELNQAPTGPKIIQIGAVVGNIHTGEILERLSVIINCRETLEPFIIKLTGITQESVDSGSTLYGAFLELEQLHRKYGSFVNVIVWGNGDVRALTNELVNSGIKVDPALFGRRELDAKTLYVAYRIANNLFPAGGLAKAMNTLKMKFVGRKHDALWDSENTFQIYRKLISYYKREETK